MCKYKKINIFLGLLVGVISCLMVSMLYMGGNINFKCFFNSEKIYDFPEEDFVKNSKGWEYNEDKEGYLVTKSNAVHKYRVGEKTGKWKCLYVNIDKANVDSIYATLEYYDKNKILLSEQSIQLNVGENLILLEEEIPLYKIGIRLRDAEGTFFSIQSMQARSEISGYTTKRFLKVLVISILIFLVLFSVGGIVWKHIKHKPGGKLSKGIGFNKILQSAYVIVGNYVGNIAKKRLTYKNTVMQMLFCCMFMLITMSDIIGVNGKETYRYFELVCTVFLVAEGAILWENNLKEIKWENPLVLSWIGLWCMVSISDFFVGKGNKFIGYVMLIGTGFFIFVWNQVKSKKAVIKLIMLALEIDFWVILLFCIFFRHKKITVYYNGVFATPEKMAMYSLLMFCIFLVEIMAIIEKKVSVNRWIIYGSGMSVSLYLVLRSGGIISGFTLIIVLIIAVIFRIWSYLLRKINIIELLKKQIGNILMMISIAFVVTISVYFLLERLPFNIEMDIAIENEQTISVLDEETLEKYQMIYPEELENVISKDKLKIHNYQKSYARMIGLYGNIDQIYDYRKPIDAYNGYLEIMYRYGIYSVIPFFIYQIYSIYACIIKYKRGQCLSYLIILLIDIIYLFFCIFGNAMISLTNPVEICFFILNGINFDANM